VAAPAPWAAGGGGDLWESLDDSSIRVCVRKRPMLRTEIIRHDFDVISTEAGHQSLVVHEPKTKVDMSKEIASHRFVFDAVFNESDSNAAIYQAALRPLLQHVFAGGAATVFAFGQTGSGKTCTMAGHGDESAADGNAVGLYALAAADVVSAAHADGATVAASFFEVYRGQVLDLLNARTKVDVLEDGKGRVQVVGLTERRVESAEEMLRLVKEAEEARATGATSANETSSRSHAILRVQLRDASGKIIGKLSMVDLAGSERAADSSSKDRQTRIEGAEINKSLLCLKECIRALDSGSSHTPFRGSKLTQVLRDSFVERARTTMIAAISPGSSAAEYTLNTLRYAARLKEFSARRPPPPRRPPSGAAASPGAARFGTPSAVSPAARRGPATPGEGGGRYIALTPPRTRVFDAPPAAPAIAVGANASERQQALGSAADNEAATPTAVESADGVEAADEEDGASSKEDEEKCGIDDLSKSMKLGGAEGDFFQSVAAVTRAERQLLRAHREAVDESEDMLALEKQLLEDRDSDSPCSLDEYAASLEKVLHHKMRLCIRVQARLDALKQGLADEEAQSARVKKLPVY